MAHIKEPKGVDFITESKPLTDEERKAISEFIKKDKEKRNKSAEEMPGGIEKKRKAA